MANEEIKKIIENVKEGGKKPSLLLHACCAPCSSSVLHRIAKYFDITIFYYNPSISPKEEFIKRYDAIKVLLSHYPQVKLILGDYENEEYLKLVSGLEKEQEGGKRCEICFKQRLEKSASLAKDYDYFATTLTVSPHKNATLINEIGFRAAQKFGTKYLPSDFKKEDGYLLSIQLSKEYGLYRQDYCGCNFEK